MSIFFLVSYIVSALLSTGSLITGIYVGNKRWQTVRVLPKALRLFLMFSCFPFFFAISISSLYIAFFYLCYNTQSHYTVDFVRHIISFSANQIRSAFILIIFERIIATLKLEKYTMSDKVTLFWRFTIFSYFTSFLYVAYNFYAKSMPDKSYLSIAVSYYVYSAHIFMFATCIVLYLMNRRMYKFSAYQITLKRRCTIAQIVKSLKYLFPTILIYSFFAQFGSMISIIVSSLNLPTLPLCSPHIFFNISFILIYFRHYCIHLESVTTVKRITIIKNPLGKIIPTDAKADQYFNDLQHQWK